MRRHRGLCAFRASPRKQSSFAALSPPPCHWLPGRDLPLRWQRPSALAGHKVSPSPLTHGGRGHGSPAAGVGVWVWGGWSELAAGAHAVPAALHPSGSPPAAPARAPRPPVDASSQLVFSFSFFWMLGCLGLVLPRPPPTPRTPRLRGHSHPGPGLDQLAVGRPSRAPQGGGALPAWPGRRAGTSRVPRPRARPRPDCSPSRCAGLDACRRPAARAVPPWLSTRPPGDLRSPSASPASVSPPVQQQPGTRWEPPRPRPRPRPRGQPIGRRRQGGVSRPGPGQGPGAGRGFRRPPARAARAAGPGRGAEGRRVPRGARLARARGGGAGAWAGDAAAPRRGQRAAGAEAAAASALPGAASLGALARRTRRRRTGPRCPGAGGRSRGSGSRASTSRDPERRRPGEGPGGACAGPGGAGRARWVWCGGSPGPGGRPLLGLLPSAGGLGDAGSTGCPPEGRPSGLGPGARPSLGPGDSGRHRRGGVSRDHWGSPRLGAGGPDRRTPGAARPAAAVGREKLARGAALRNRRTLRPSAAGRPAEPRAAAPRFSPARLCGSRARRPRPGLPASWLRGPGGHRAVPAALREPGSALTPTPDRQLRASVFLAFLSLKEGRRAPNVSVKRLSKKSPRLCDVSDFAGCSGPLGAARPPPPQLPLLKPGAPSSLGTAWERVRWAGAGRGARQGRGAPGFPFLLK